MRALRGILLLCAILAVPLTAAMADTLSGNLTADNVFYAYLSTSATSQGTLFAQGSSWQNSVSFSIPLVAGTTYYLQVEGINTGSYNASTNPGSILGSFSLTGNFQFSNSAQNLLTDTTDWTYATTGFGAAANMPEAYGANNQSSTIWYEVNHGPISGISGNAEWIWYNGDVGYLATPLYFETVITPTPEPGSFFLLGCGLLIAVGMWRRRLIPVVDAV